MVECEAQSHADAERGADDVDRAADGDNLRRRGVGLTRDLCYRRAFMEQIRSKYMPLSAPRAAERRPNAAQGCGRVE